MELTFHTSKKLSKKIGPKSELQHFFFSSLSNITYIVYGFLSHYLVEVVVYKINIQLSPIIQNNILIYMSSHWLDIIMCLLGELELVVMHKQSNGGYISSYNGLLTTKIRTIPVHY